MDLELRDGSSMVRLRQMWGHGTVPQSISAKPGESKQSAGQIGTSRYIGKLLESGQSPRR